MPPVGLGVPFTMGSQMPQRVCDNTWPVNDSFHPSIHPTRVYRTCHMPDASLGTGESWVHVTDRARPQASTPRPHCEHGSKGPEPAFPGGRPSARECVAALPSTGVQAGNCPSLSAKLQGRRFAFGVPPLHSFQQTSVGHLHGRPGKRCPKGPGNTPGLKKPPVSKRSTHKYA